MPHTRRPKPVNGATTLLAAIVSTFLLGGCTTSVAASPAGTQKTPVHLDVIGDSLSTGINTFGGPWTKTAQTLFSAEGWNVQIANSSENGAGYVAQGDGGQVFLNLVDRTVNARSRVVLVFGSDNDVGQPDLFAAITETLGRIKTLAPGATLIVVGPPATPADPEEQLVGVRDALQSATQQAGGQFIDPLALKWFQGSDSEYIGPDGEHPNAAGKEYLAQKIVEIKTLSDRLANSRAP